VSLVRKPDYKLCQRRAGGLAVDILWHIHSQRAGALQVRDVVAVTRLHDLAEPSVHLLLVWHTLDACSHD
jgi:hypothetical protein